MKRILVIVLVALATLVAAASSRALDAQERENRVTREKPETEPHAQQADEQAANDQRRTNQDSPLTRFERYQIYFSGALVFLTRCW
jgi:Ni/Co efflux regulator RcnB